MNCASAVNAGNPALEHDEARTRQLCRGFEIHRSADGGKLVMLFRRKTELARGAPTVHFDVIGLVGTLRHLVERVVRDQQQLVAQFGIKRTRASLHCPNLGLLFSHERAQALEFGLVAFGLGCADLFRRRVLRGLRSFGGMDRGAAFLIKREDFRRHRRKPPARKGCVKDLGVFADSADVVHVIPHWLRDRV